MTMAGLLFTRLSDRTISTVHHGVEYRIREGRYSFVVLGHAGNVLYRAGSIEDAVDFISDEGDE